MNENNPTHNQTADDEIDLLALFKKLFKQRGLIVAFALAFFLFSGAFQLSKLAFKAPKSITYPIAIDFISKDNFNYPNGMGFSPEDIIAPENISVAMRTLNISADKKSSLSEAISVQANHAFIKDAESILQARLSEKKISSDQVEEVKKALATLKLQAKSYVALQLDLSKIKLSTDQAGKLLKAIVSSWAKKAVERGLITPDFSYPSEPFKYDKQAVILDNYDKLADYGYDLKEAFSAFKEFSGSHTVSVNGQNLNDLNRQISGILNNDIYVMRTYGYSASKILVETNPLLEVQMFSQLRVKNLDRQEMEKRIKTYDHMLIQLTYGSEKENLRTAGANISLESQSTSTKVDQGVLEQLLSLGSQLSSSDLRKEIVNKRLETAEKLFKMEKNIATIQGSNKGSEDNAYVASLAGQREILALMPKIFDDTVIKVNKIQKTFLALVKEYEMLSLNNQNTLYSAMGTPEVDNSLGFSLKKVIIILLAATLMGAFLGMGIALLRAPFTEFKH